MNGGSNMKTILVTGGAGFIGSNLVAALQERGTHRVVVCDNMGHDDKWRNLRKHHIFEMVPTAQLFPWLHANASSLEMIFHLGGVSSTVEKDMDLVLQNNFTLSIDLWRWCSANGVRLLYNASSAVYGDGEQGFADNMDLAYLTSLRPMGGYGWSKLLFDVHVATVTRDGETPPPQWIGLRLFNNYGPNEYHKHDHQSVISKIAPHAIQGGRVNLYRSQRPDYEDGGQKRDVVYVKDGVKVMLWCLENPGVSGLFNLGSGIARSFNDMAHAIFAALGRAPNIHYVDMPERLAPHYQYFTQANMSKLRAAGYKEPFMTLEEGISDFVKNYLLGDDHYR